MTNDLTPLKLDSRRRRVGPRHGLGHSVRGDDDLWLRFVAAAAVLVVDTLFSKTSVFLIEGERRRFDTPGARDALSAGPRPCAAIRPASADFWHPTGSTRVHLGIVPRGELT